MRRVFVTGIIASFALASFGSWAQGAAKASDAAIVKAGLLTIQDFPPGWTEKPRTSSSDTNLSGYGSTCNALQKKADVLKKLRAGHGDSPDFKQGSFDEISNSLGVFRGAAGAKAAFALFKSPGISTCFQKAITAKLEKQASTLAGATYKSSVGKLTVPPAGDETVGFEIAVDVSAKGLTVHLVIDEQVVLVGRVGLNFVFLGEGTSPMLDNQPVVQAAVSRVQAAEAATS